MHQFDVMARKPVLWADVAIQTNPKIAAFLIFLDCRVGTIKKSVSSQ